MLGFLPDNVHQKLMDRHVLVVTEGVVTGQISQRSTSIGGIHSECLKQRMGILAREDETRRIITEPITAS